MKRNVVLISLDTLRYDCVGACPDKVHLRAYGLEPKLRTPNLDAFFNKSLYFTQARTPAPYTTAAHASVMTGLYPNHHGVRPFYKWGLAEGVGTLAEELKARGYVTVAVQERGEQTFLRTGSGILRGFDVFFADELDACAYCAAQSSPCFLFMHTFDIHSPYCWSHVDAVRREDAERKNIERWLARRLRIAPPHDDSLLEQQRFISRTSQASRRALGGKGASRMFLEWYVRGVNWFDKVRWPRMLQTLQDAGLYDDAIVAVFADHGEACLPDFPLLPLAHNEAILEDVLRVPLVFRAPDLAPRRVWAGASLIDVVPTVVGYLGINPSAVGRGGQMDGRSLLAVDGGPASGSLCYFAETWRTWAPRGEQRRKGNDWWRGQVQDPSEPYQVCVRRGDLKVLSHPGVPRLRRFMRPTARCWARIADLWRALLYTKSTFAPVLQRFIPQPVRTAIRGLRRRLAGLLLRKRQAPPQTNMLDRAPVGCRHTPAFAFDLRDDPLEEQPLRLPVATNPAPYVELLQRIREYWENGVQGTVINLEPADEQEVMRHLRDLGYVD